MPAKKPARAKATRTARTKKVVAKSSKTRRVVAKAATKKRVKPVARRASKSKAKSKPTRVTSRSARATKPSVKRTATRKKAAPPRRIARRPIDVARSSGDLASSLGTSARPVVADTHHHPLGGHGPDLDGPEVIDAAGDVHSDDRDVDDNEAALTAAVDDVDNLERDPAVDSDEPIDDETPPTR